MYLTARFWFLHSMRFLSINKIENNHDNSQAAISRLHDHDNRRSRHNRQIHCKENSDFHDLSGMVSVSARLACYNT
jgi:hypothetical protein